MITLNYAHTIPVHHAQVTCSYMVIVSCRFSVPVCSLFVVFPSVLTFPSPFIISTQRNPSNNIPLVCSSLPPLTSLFRILINANSRFIHITKSILCIYIAMLSGFSVLNCRFKIPTVWFIIVNIIYTESVMVHITKLVHRIRITPSCRLAVPFKSFFIISSYVSSVIVILSLLIQIRWRKIRILFFYELGLSQVGIAVPERIFIFKKCIHLAPFTDSICLLRLKSMIWRLRHRSFSAKRIQDTVNCVIGQFLTKIKISN